MIKINLSNFGMKIKTRRGKKGIRSTANKIGISPATLSRIENGKLLDLKNFVKLCRWLEVSPNDVLSDEIMSLPMAKFTKEDYAFMYECIERTVQLARLKNRKH